MLKRVEYLTKHSDEVLFDLMFSLDTKSLEKDAMCLVEDSTADAVHFIEDGAIEVYTKFE